MKTRSMTTVNNTYIVDQLWKVPMVLRRHPGDMYYTGGSAILGGLNNKSDHTLDRLRQILSGKCQ